MTRAFRTDSGWFAFLLTLLISFTVAAAAENELADKPADKHSIHLVRPEKVGDRYSITAQGALIRETVVRGEKDAHKITSSGYGIHLEGTVKVLKVRPDGRAKEVALTIKKCTGITGNKSQEQELIAPEKTLIATGREDGTDYTFKNGDDLSDEAQSALQLVVSLEAGDDDHNDDEVIGTLDDRKVGDEWPVNAHLAAEDARKQGVDVKDDAMGGTVRLAAVEQVAGTECLKIQGEMDAHAVTPPAAEKAGLPKQMEPLSGSIKYRFTEMIPTDDKLGAMSESGSLRMSNIYTGKLPGSDENVKLEEITQKAVQIDRRVEK